MRETLATGESSSGPAQQPRNGSPAWAEPPFMKPWLLSPMPMDGMNIRPSAAAFSL